MNPLQAWAGYWARMLSQAKEQQRGYGRSGRACEVRDKKYQGPAEHLYSAEKRSCQRSRL